MPLERLFVPVLDVAKKRVLIHTGGLGSGKRVGVMQVGCCSNTKEK